MILACGLITLGIGAVILLGLVADPIRWAGVFVGLKLLLFGGSLTWIAFRAVRSDPDPVYGSEIPTPETGELYAVYFGTAFHLGVFIGNREVVHYLNDNHVYRVTWEQFLEGRIPQHWTYPDLEPVSGRDHRKHRSVRGRQDLSLSSAQVQLREFRHFLQVGRNDQVLEVRPDRQRRGDTGCPSPCSVWSPR